MASASVWAITPFSSFNPSLAKPQSVNQIQGAPQTVSTASGLQRNETVLTMHAPTRLAHSWQGGMSLRVDCLPNMPSSQLNVACSAK